MKRNAVKDSCSVQASLRNDSLLQSSIQRIQNDTQRDAPNNHRVKGLSPQNSVRSRASTFSSSGQVAPCIVVIARISVVLIDWVLYTNTVFLHITGLGSISN